MATNINFSPFIGQITVLLFMFSTIYTFMYLYSVDSLQSPKANELSDPNDPNGVKVQSGGIFGFVINAVDGIIEVTTWISPFFLVKELIWAIMKDTPFLYTLMNLLILRPASWAVSIFTLNFIISKIPTVSGESG